MLQHVGRRTMFWASIAAIGLLLAGIAALLDEVLEGETQEFDMFVLLALRTPGNLADPLGPAWFEEAARDVTALGSFTVPGMLRQCTRVHPAR